MFATIISILHWILVLALLISIYPIAAIVWLVTLPFDKKLKIFHLFTSCWAVLLIRVNPLVRIKVMNREKLRSGATYVIACNHQSLLDIVVIFSIFAHFKWVAKKELFSVPILGWTMKMNKYVAVDRGNKISHVKMMHECESHLRNGSSIMIFPEGTRSENGEIQNFKDGAFIMAQNTGTSILPVLIDGTAEAIPKNELFFKKLTFIRVKILDPVDISAFGEISVKGLNVKVREIMVKGLAEMRDNK
jgi:1-acyl-sn-glycerol-3-phosphate acyltransferase